MSLMFAILISFTCGVFLGAIGVILLVRDQVASYEE